MGLPSLSLYATILDSMTQVTDFLCTSAGNRLATHALDPLCDAVESMVHAGEKLQSLLTDPWRADEIQHRKVACGIYTYGFMNAHTDFWRVCNSHADILTADEYRELVSATNVSVRFEASLQRSSAALRCAKCVLSD